MMSLFSLNSENRMDEIVNPLPTYDFTQLMCISPSSISGGNYFIRILKKPGQKPFYIQPPKCVTKQGIVKAGKKLVSDLLFKHEDESFTEFLESLETFCRTQLFLNKDKWFDSDLTENDIEESFVPTAKLYKSGKLHSVRVNIPIRLGKCSLKIFNEDEQDIDIESIVETTHIMSILEVQGIRCSARNFQLELEVKQMMVLNPVNLFETCVFTSKPSTLGKNVPNSQPTENSPPTDGPEEEKEISVMKNEKEPEERETGEKEKEPEERETDEKEITVMKNEITHPIENEKVVPAKQKNKAGESLAESVEIDLEIPEEEIGEMKLKKRNYVYYNMYKEAKRKARIARDFAIASYLEAKQIRHNFLEEADLSEDDDNILENELELLNK